MARCQQRLALRRGPARQKGWLKAASTGRITMEALSRSPLFLLLLGNDSSVWSLRSFGQLRHTTRQREPPKVRTRLNTASPAIQLRDGECSEQIFSPAARRAISRASLAIPRKGPCQGKSWSSKRLPRAKDSHEADALTSQQRLEPVGRLVADRAAERFRQFHDCPGASHRSARRTRERSHPQW